MTRGVLFLLFAFAIDGFQALVSWGFFVMGAALQSLTPIGGGAGGALAAGWYCWDTSFSIIECAVGGGIAGAAASAFGVPLGIAMGFICNLFISITLGGLLLFLMWLSGMAPGSKLLIRGGFGFVGEIVPGLNIFPFWTGLVISFLLKKEAQKGGAVGLIAGMANSPSPSGIIKGTVRTTAHFSRGTSESSQTEETEASPRKSNARIALPLLGGEIRQRLPANDNVLPKQQKLAA